MAEPTRRVCPSCHEVLSPLAAECLECGLTLAPPRQGRPMLFQASALAQTTFEAPSRALVAPALGRVAPVAVEVQPEEIGAATADGAPQPMASRPEARPPAQAALPAPTTPLLWVELSEVLLLAAVQAVALALPALALGMSPLRLLTEGWTLVVPYLAVVSWFLFMIPLVLMGQSPLMGRFGVTLPETEPHRRAIYSLAHLASICGFPVSFLCMTLSQRHQTLGEILSGQELLALPSPRIR